MTQVNHCDLLVVGGGPAGLAAATQAALLGLDTIVLDEQAAPGGQIYRAVTSTPLKDRGILGSDYWHGSTLVERFRQSGSLYESGATVWAIGQRVESESGFEVGYSVQGTARLLHPRHVILATGAQERPFPIAGWTLPGVITAGAAQILLKSAGLVPLDRTILAGCGPLLYLLAWQYLNAGVKISALLDTTPKGRLTDALPHAWDFVRSPYLRKGLGLLRVVKGKVPIFKAVTHLAAEGRDRLEAVRFVAKGVSRTLPAEQLMLHQGVIPNINLSQAAGVENRWNEALSCWEPIVDDWGATPVPYLSITGDGAGIAGAQAAEHRGKLAALHAAFQLGVIDEAERNRSATESVSALRRALRGRRFFDTLYQAPAPFRRPGGSIIVCRCEEVTAEQVRETVKLGCQGPNQMKAFLRCGMGPCQGRFCGVTVTELIAEEYGVSPAQVGYYRQRFPTKPLTVGELASLPQTQASNNAVIRFTRHDRGS